MTQSSDPKQLRIQLIPTSDKNFCDGVPDLNKNFKLLETKVLSQELKENEVMIQIEYISVDPYLRGQLKTYSKFPGSPCISGQVGRVLKSKCDKFIKDDIVFGYWGWQTYSIIPYQEKTNPLTAATIELIHRPDKNNKDSDISHSYYLGAYGMPGMTAYYGLLERANLQKNSILLVSGAAGAVGSIVGQIGKIYGCYVIGTAGTQQKINWLKNDLKFDYVFNYKDFKNVTDMQENLKKAIEDANKKGFKGGINCYFDNTGGIITQSVWDLLARRAFVIICGQISVYNRTQNEGVYMEPHMLSKLIYKEVTIGGISVGNISTECRNNFRKEMKDWILNKKIQVQQTVVEGFENTPKALIGLFQGTNMGKMVVKV